MSSLSSFSSPFSSGDCNLGDFVGTWKGQVEFEGSTLDRGPYEFSLHEDGMSIKLKDETGVEYILVVDGCNAINTISDEGMKMVSTYTFSEGELQVTSIIEIPDGNGEIQKMEVKGSMQRVE